MENFQNSLTGCRLSLTLNSFRETIVLDYSVCNSGDFYYLSITTGSFIPEILITSLISLGFIFNSISIDDNRRDCLRVLFSIDSKDI